MKLKPFALGVALGTIWGGALFLMTLLSVFTGYSRLFLEALPQSLYPGYTITPKGSILGLLYGFVDGLVSGILIVWIYNKIECDQNQQKARNIKEIAQKEGSSNKDGENLRLLFQVKIDDIRYSKQQQWNMMFLTLSAIAALVTLCLALPASDNAVRQYFKWPLMIIIAIISIIGLYFLRNYCKDIIKYRKEKTDIFNYLFSCEEEVDTTDVRHFTTVFYGVIFIAVILGVLVIWSSCQ